MRPFFFLILFPVTLKIHGNELKYLQMTMSVCCFVLLTRYWGLVMESGDYISPDCEPGIEPGVSNA